MQVRMSLVAKTFTRAFEQACKQFRYSNLPKADAFAAARHPDWSDAVKGAGKHCHSSFVAHIARKPLTDLAYAGDRPSMKANAV